MADPPGVAKQEIHTVVMGKGYAEVCTNNGKPSFGLIESVPWRSPSMPTFTIEFAGELNGLLGAVGAQGVSFKNREAIGPDPNLSGRIVWMPVMNDRAATLIDKDLETGIIY